MPNGYLVEQNAQGRWIWAVVVSDYTFSSNSVQVSPVTFQRECEATADYEQHTAAVLDDTGRLMRTKRELRTLIRAGMYETVECNDAYFGQVHWRPCDAEGSNWDICHSCGDSWSLQSELIQRLVQRLRDCYNLSNVDA